VKKINEIDVFGKTIAIRVDINLPVCNGCLQKNKRLIEHAKTLAELSNRGAKLVVLGHQGKKGKDDFLSMSDHAKFLREICGKEIKFMGVNNWDKIKNEIKNLNNRDILLLENIRFVEDETTRPFNANFLEYLSTLCDYFVLDALSVAHREHASVVGFSKKMKCFMGSVLEREINALKKLEGKDKIVFIIGGAKVEDSIEIIKYWLKSGKVDKILMGGVMGNLFIKAKYREIGINNEDFLKRIGADKYVQSAREILENYPNKVEIPADVVLEVDGFVIEQKVDFGMEICGTIKDIGQATANKYSKIIEPAKVVVMNGPVGVYEEEGFENGTKKLLNAIVKNKGYSIIGGGHTISAIEKFGIREDNFSYVSLSGKAFLEYLSGKKLPGLVALE